MARGEPLIRQWNLIKALQAHHFGISADELSARVGCSKRQVQRDLNILQQVGFPISFEQLDFGRKYKNYCWNKKFEWVLYSLFCSLVREEGPR